MSRGLEILLGSLLKRTAKVYISSFANAYKAFGGEPEFYQQNLDQYAFVVGDTFNDTCRMSAASINSYLDSYAVRVRQSPDEFKIIYFQGRAIERHLDKLGLHALAKVHMFIMIGLLDYRLKTKGIYKPALTKAMTSLVRQNTFDSELGNTGCYLTYKCVSTTKLS